jgi:hypothetical protein
MSLGYKPTSDPNWIHEHRYQGYDNACERKGCARTFPVYCHSGHRRYCDICSRAVRRDRDREVKKVQRARARLNVWYLRAQGEMFVEITRRRRRIQAHRSDLKVLKTWDKMIAARLSPPKPKPEAGKLRRLNGLD